MVNQPQPNRYRLAGAQLDAIVKRRLGAHVLRVDRAAFALDQIPSERVLRVRARAATAEGSLVVGLVFGEQLGLSADVRGDPAFAEGGVLGQQDAAAPLGVPDA